MTIDGVSNDTLNKTTKKQSHDTELKGLMDRVKPCFSYTKELRKVWERDVKLYNNERVKRNYKGLTDTFVPMAFSTVETIKAAIVTGDLSIRYQPQDIYKYLTSQLTRGVEFATPQEEQNFLIQKIQEKLKGGITEDEDLEAVNAITSYFWDVCDFDDGVESLVDSGLKIGQGALMLTWEVDRPKLTHVPFRDYIWDINATEDGECEFQGRRYLTTKSKLEDVEILDPVKRENVKRYKNLDQIGKRDTEEKTDKEEKEAMFEGSLVSQDLEAAQEQVEVIELYFKDKVYSIANRRTIIEAAPNPITAQAELLGIAIDDDMKLPGITWANYKDPSLLVGRSEISTFWQEQERLNDATNQKGDAVTNALLQNNRIDPKYQHLAKLLGIPGSTIPAPQGAVERLPQATVPNAAFNEEVAIKGNIRETTATDQIVKGVGSTSDITATEANLQVANADSRIKQKIKSLERRPLKRLARLLFTYIRLFISDPMLIPVETNQGIQPRLFSPEKYTQDFTPKISLTVGAKNTKKLEQQAALGTYQVLIQDPTNNLEAVKRVFLPKITDVDKGELESIITPPAQPAPMTTEPPLDPNMAVAQSEPTGVMA